MFDRKKLFEEKNIHLVFEISLIFKAIFATLEILSGVLVYIISPTVLSSFLISLTESDLIDTKPDALVTYLTRTAESISIGSTHYATQIRNSLTIARSENVLRTRLPSSEDHGPSFVYLVAASYCGHLPIQRYSDREMKRLTHTRMCS